MTLPDHKANGQGAAGADSWRLQALQQCQNDPMSQIQSAQRERHLRQAAEHAQRDIPRPASTTVASATTVSAT
jgi:hypothetical protein